MSEYSLGNKLLYSRRALWQFIPHLMNEYREKGCRQQAAALTYMTLFAVVPTMTVVFTMFSLFPAFDGLAAQLQDFLFRYLLPESGLEIESQLKAFTEEARSLTLAGVGMLVVTAYLMIKNIESTFNRIWGVGNARRGLNNFLLYWAILSLGPLLLGVGIAISTYLLSLRIFSQGYDPTGIMPTLLSFSPWVLTSVAFTLLFAAVPNCKVPFKNALVGGVLTAVFFELFKDLFGWLVAHTSYTAVYGTFAMVPLFLLWIYILWMIVLSGAVLVYTLTTFQTVRADNNARYPDLIAALLALWTFRQCQVTGRGATDEELLKVGIESEQWLRVSEALVRHRVISVTHDDEYVLCRNLDLLTLRQLADVVGVESQMPGVSDYLQSFDWFPNVASRLLSIDQQVELEFDVPVSELFEVPETEQEPYPGEGQGLEELRDELDGYGSPEPQLPTAQDLNNSAGAFSLTDLPTFDDGEFGQADLLGGEPFSNVSNSFMSDVASAVERHAYRLGEYDVAYADAEHKDSGNQDNGSPDGEGKEGDRVGTDNFIAQSVENSRFPLAGFESADTEAAAPDALEPVSSEQGGVALGGSGEPEADELKQADLPADSPEEGVAEPEAKEPDRDGVDADDDGDQDALPGLKDYLSLDDSEAKTRNG
ncbi:YihY family inner membrane protein [Aestuariicella hydrocarbonica]|uniref:UPF0761 membrane protein G8770_01190 n=1 Tax=Pseudomaricurvus hydrocarbonicus TaxID=1470433 RepID=A0A9E5JY10_9GAMM|nr:YihY family inner membrane protein [Aestuariicella hydrocarbonica]NHO64157.1 YihY family inner membrane protein [Aestuariicella hydrocarbonica]